MIRRIKIKHIKSGSDFDMVLRIIEQLKTGCVKPSVLAYPVVRKVKLKHYSVCTGTIEIIAALMQDREYITVEVENVGRNKV